MDIAAAAKRSVSLDEFPLNDYGDQRVHANGHLTGNESERLNKKNRHNHSKVNAASETCLDAAADSACPQEAAAAIPADSGSELSLPISVSLPKSIVAVYTEREEKANMLTHAAGVPLALGLFILLLLKAQGSLQVIGSIAFGLGTVSTFLASACYHAAQNAELKRRLRICDHSAIYLNIAGLYTPYMLVCAANEGGLPITIAVWCIALFGILIEFLWVGRPKWMIGLTYVLLGWGLALKCPAIYAASGTGALILLLAGGIICSLGVLFYVQKNKEFMHAVFHVFVLISIIPTWISIYGYVFS